MGDSPSDFRWQLADRRAIVIKSTVMLGFLFIALGLLAGRLVDLQVLRHAELQEETEKREEARLRRKPVRGPILDRRGRPLAVSVRVNSIAIDPLILEERGIGLSDTLSLLHDALLLTPVEEQAIRERARPRIDPETGEENPRRFVWVRRRVSDAAAQALRDRLERFHWRERQLAEASGMTPRRVEGVIVAEEQTRRYPSTGTGAHLVGFTDIDGKGREAIERVTDAYLQDLGETHTVRRDAKNRRLVDDLIHAPDSGEGCAVVLAMDATIQAMAEQELARTVEQYTPAAATAIVMDPQTGDVLALANYPTYDPNAPAATPAGHRFNHAVASIMEPGSTFKPFVFARALESGAISLEDKIHCENGAWRMSNGRVLHDSHGYGRLTAEMVLVKSSNIGMAKIADKLGQRRLYECVLAFGFGAKTGVDLDGEQVGKVAPLRKWTSYSMGSVPMGQEVAVTPLQLARAYCALANGGWLVRPRVIREIRAPDGMLSKAYPVDRGATRLFSAKTARQIRSVMRKVVTDGTGRRLRMAEYGVAGKTGTAQLPVNAAELAAGHRGYSPDRYISSFVGFAPWDNPKLVVLVSVREPHGAHYGGTVAGPAVREITRRVLYYLGQPTELHVARVP